jgi:hypothetical protein
MVKISLEIYYNSYNFLCIAGDYSAEQSKCTANRNNATKLCRMKSINLLGEIKQIHHKYLASKKSNQLQNIKYPCTLDA